MGLVEAFSGAVDWVLSSSSAPGDPGPLTGPGSGPAVAGNGPGSDPGSSGDGSNGDGSDGESDGSGGDGSDGDESDGEGDGSGGDGSDGDESDGEGDGSGGDGSDGDGNEKGPFDDLIDAAKKTWDWAKKDIPEIVDVMTKPDSELTEDERIVRDAVDDPFVPVPDLSDMDLEGAYGYADELTDYVGEKGAAGAEGAVAIDKYNREKQELLDTDHQGEVDSGDGDGDGDGDDDGGDDE